MILDDNPSDALKCFTEWMRSNKRDASKEVFKDFVDVQPIDVVKMFLDKRHPESEKYKELLIKATENENRGYPLRMDKEKWDKVVDAPIKDQFHKDRIALSEMAFEKYVCPIGEKLETIGIFAESELLSDIRQVVDWQQSVNQLQSPEYFMRSSRLNDMLRKSEQILNKLEAIKAAINE